MSSPKVPEAPLTVARRFTAAGAQAWPAETLHYDGAWAIRLSNDCAARRQNCVTPLDPSDDADIDARLDRAAERFSRAGKAARFLISPLVSQRIVDALHERGWETGHRTSVHSLALDACAVDTTPELTRMKGETFASVHRQLGAASASRGDRIAAILARIEPPSFCFVLEEDGAPRACAVCVRQGDMIGIFELTVAETYRQQGFGGKLMRGILGWAKSRKATSVWMQIETDNAPSAALAASLGFEPVYDYFYMNDPAGGEKT